MCMSVVMLQALRYGSYQALSGEGYAQSSAFCYSFLRQRESLF